MKCIYSVRILIHDYAGHPFPISLSRELAKRGHAVTHAFASQLLTPRGVLCRNETDPVTLMFRSVPMSPDYRANKYSFLKRLGYERTYGKKLAALVQELRPDIILSGQTPSDPQFALVTAAAQFNIPIITWVQDFYSLAVDKLARRKLPFFGALAGAWYRYLDAECFRKSTRIIAISEDFLPIFSEFGTATEKVTVIPNWAPLDELPLRPRRNHWSSAHDLSDKFVFLYSGTLAMKHNPDLLRQLAVHFLGDPEVRIVVVSEGPGADYLCERKVTDHLSNLLLLPFQSFQEMPDVLATAEVLVTVLEADAGVFSVPSKVLTYHAAGRAILGSLPLENLAAKIIQKQDSGICVRPDNIGGLLDAAVSFRSDTVKRIRMASNARLYAEAEFNIVKIADKFEHVLKVARISSQ